jgi:hypothetical protein
MASPIPKSNGARPTGEQGHEHEHEHEHAVIDEGMRRWYESCSCCMSAAYPEIKRALDEERMTTA